MTQLAAKRIRLALDPYDHTMVEDELTVELPKLWRGTNASIEVAIFNNGSILTDFSNIVSVVMEIHGAIRLSAPLTSKTVLAAQLTACSKVDWDAKAADKRHAIFTLAYDETQYDLGTDGSQTATFWIVFHATTTSGEKITLGGTQLTVEEDGAENGIPAIGVADAPLWNISGNELQLWNTTLGKFQSLYITGAAGAETIVIGEAP